MIRRHSIIRLIIINLLVAVALLECSLQIIHAIGADSSNRYVKRIYGYLIPHSSWEETFLQKYMDKGEMIYGGIHQYHPTRGWAMRPSAKITTAKEVTYTTNAQGYRSLYDFENKPGKYQVMVLGDSFSFGDAINDDETWPHLLQLKSPSLNVLNMAGTGYGTDQMLITLEEEIKKYRPNLIIVGFIDDDLNRSTLAFRDYKKPLFILNSGKLELTNTPIGDPYSVLKEISQRRYLSYGRIQTLNLINFYISNLTRLPEGQQCRSQCQNINTAIFDRINHIAEESGAELLILYLPWGQEILSNDITPYGEAFFNSYSTNIKTNNKYTYFINPRKNFVAANFSKAPKHYHINETELLSSLVLDQIEQTKSWRCEQNKKCWH